ncbi:hypothetical protein EJB05_22429, partial [Eragrostis curvula]
METKQGLRLLCVLTLVLLQLFTTICHSNTDNDIRALLSFKSLIREDPLNALSSWNNLSSSTSNGTCRWTGVICGSRSSTGRVISLQLRGLGLVGTISPHLGNLTRLRVLDLSDNKLEGEIPPSLGDCLALHNLNLSVNFLSGTIPSSMGQLSKLDVLNIRKNNISGLIPSSNALSGPIPPQIGHLVNLVTVDLSSNKLSGEIPSTLGNCLELRALYLQGNLLSGQIPKDFSALRGIELLDLSDNRLSGPIPEFLESFQLLKVLNLSFNLLSGPVPRKGIFSNASSVSLESNGALCGGSIVFNFPACPSQPPESPAQRRHLLILIISIVGASVLIMICTVGCYCVKKLKSSPGGANRDQDSTLLNVIYQRISYAELYMATNSFSEENLIGRGSFSSVYKGTLSRGVHSVDVAVKLLLCDSLDHNGDEFKALVLELISNGSLDKWLHPTIEGTENATGTLSLMQRLSIALDVADALEYLHHHINPCIVHCDIKPSNILLDEDMIAHVGDFGLAKIMNVEASGQSLGESSSVGIKGTIGYLPPEYGMGTEISKDGDVFSFGVLLLEILTGRRPTDSYFHDGTSLPKYVERASPDRLLDVVDRTMPHNGHPRDNRFVRCSCFKAWLSVL